MHPGGQAMIRQEPHWRRGKSTHWGRQSWAGSGSALLDVPAGASPGNGDRFHGSGQRWAVTPPSAATGKHYIMMAPVGQALPISTLSLCRHVAITAGGGAASGFKHNSVIDTRHHVMPGTRRALLGTPSPSAGGDTRAALRRAVGIPGAPGPGPEGASCEPDTEAGRCPTP